MVQKSSDWSFDHETRATIDDESLRFLSSYTRINDYSVLRKRVEDLQKAAVANLHVYRCVARTTFLTPKINVFAAYRDAQRLGRILEIGACFGTEVRRFLQDGFRPENIVATDVTDGYWKLGQDLFGDQPENVKTIFADTGCAESDLDPAVAAEYGQCDLVVAMAVFHVLNKAQVENMVQRIGKLCKSGGYFVGYCAGSSHEGPWRRSSDQKYDPSNDRYLHSAESLSALFSAAGFSQVDVHEDDQELYFAEDERSSLRQDMGNATCRLLIEARK